MKKMTVFAAAAALAVLTIHGLTGCAARGLNTYPEGEKYSVGDAVFTEPIESIDVEWQSGSVRIATHAEDTVLLTEETGTILTDDLRVHWWQDGATLRVRFTASGARTELLGMHRKELTLTVPETAVFRNVSVDSASARVSADELASDVVSVSTASGAIDAVCEAQHILLDTASGSVSLRQTGFADEVNINTASGGIDARLERVEALHLNSTSGAVSAEADEVNALAVKTTSGRIDCRLHALSSGSAALSSTSGAVALTLPEDAGFLARVRTSSGRFQSDFAMRKDGELYHCGDGSADVDIETTSGSIDLCRGA